MADFTEEEGTKLALRARNGDGRAFDVLREKLGAGVRGFILEARRKKGLPEPRSQDLEDLEQNVWLAAFAALPKFDPERGSFSQFVLSCVAKWEAYHWKPGRQHMELDAQEQYVVDDLLADAEADPRALMDVEMRLRARIEAFHLVLRLLFLCGGYPHQQLAFAFLKVIYAGGAKAQGSSATVVEKHGSTGLDDLSGDFLASYRRISGLSKQETSRMTEALEPLRQRLGLTVSALMQRDQASLQANQRLSESAVRDTAMSDYYSGHKQAPTAAVSDWAYGVQKRILGAFGSVDAEAGGPSSAEGKRAAACIRCKLKDIPPCGDLESPLARILAGQVDFSEAAEWLQG